MGNSKPRSDSTLKNMSPEMQEQVIAWCDMPKSEECPGGYAHAREQLIADGTRVSIGSLSEFYQWYKTREAYEDAAAMSEQQRELMAEFDPENTDRAEAYGDFVFLQLAAKARDPKTFVAVSSLRENRKRRKLAERIDTRRLDLLERRIVLLEDKAAEAKVHLAAMLKTGGGLTEETRAEIERIAGLL